MMTVEQHYEKDVETVRATAPVADAALGMREAGVGCLVVVDDDGAPIGMVTDRDLTVRLIADGIDRASALVSDVMTAPVQCVGPHDSIDEVLARMADGGFRRAPVVAEGRCVGLISLDDVLLDLARSIEDLGVATVRRVRQSRRQVLVEHLANRIEEQVTDTLSWMGDRGRQVCQAASKLARDMKDLVQRR